jgi:GR25 family glycosyltransferase involved in LPS biosynthesis
MNKLDKIYYINLDHRADRREHFEVQCKIEGIPLNKIQRFEAIDGLTHEFTTEQLAMFSRCDYLRQPFAKKIMGNQLSHYSILKEMIEKHYEYVLILQDDVIFKSGFNERLEKVIASIPDDAEIVNIGLHKSAFLSHFVPWDLSTENDRDALSKQLINDEICVLHDSINPCSLAYIVTLKGATNLVNYFDANGFLRATDWNFNDYLRNKHIFYGSTTVLCTGNPNLGSDIF